MHRGLKTQLLRATKQQNVQEGVYCNFPHRVCMQNCLEDYKFCIRHILEDKTAPFRQCSYQTKSGRRCQSAAPKLDKKEGYCVEHAKKALIFKQHQTRRKRPKENPDLLLEELVQSTTNSLDHSGDNRRARSSLDNIASKALDYASSSDSDEEAVVGGHTWWDDGDSDAESVDSDMDDMLKYAGAYTTEEVAQILRDKLIRLQALYIDQFKRLKHVLLSKRRKYLREAKLEKELYGSVSQYKKDPAQKDKYDKMIAFKRYHKKYGKEALLHRQSTERRLQASAGDDYAPPTFPKCVFQDEGLRCNNNVVPLSKFCQKHILHDQGQILYRPCSFADHQCGRPVPTLLGNEFCSLHQTSLNLRESTDRQDDQEEALEDIKEEDLEDVKEEALEDVKEETKIDEERFSSSMISPSTSGVLPDVKEENEETEDVNMDDSPPKPVVFTLADEDDDDQVR